MLTALLRQLANNPHAFDRFAELDCVVSTGASENYGEINQILCKRSLEPNALAFPSVAKWFARCPNSELKSNHALLFAQISLSRLEAGGEVDADNVLCLLEQVLEFTAFEDFSLVLTRLGQLEGSRFRIVQLLVRYSHRALRDAGGDVDRFLSSSSSSQWDESLCQAVVEFTLDNPVMHELVAKSSANREAVLRAAVACEGKGQLLVKQWCDQPDADLVAILRQVSHVNALSRLVLASFSPEVLDWLMTAQGVPLANLLFMLHEVATTWTAVPQAWTVTALDRQGLGPERVAWLCWMLGRQSQRDDDDGGVQACRALETLASRRTLTPYETSAVVGALSRLPCRNLARVVLASLS